MRAGRKQPAPGKTPAAEAPKKQKDAPVVGKIAPKAEFEDGLEDGLEDEMDDADDPTEDVTEDAADGGDGEDEPVLASPVFNDRRKRSPK